MDQDVAGGVAGPHLFQDDALVAYMRLVLSLERRRREGLGDALEVEGAEGFEEEPARLPHGGGPAHERGESVRTLVGHLQGRSCWRR